MNITRRAMLENISLASAACALGAPRLAAAATAATSGHEADWSWLEGNWDVYHERLRDRLVGSTTWDKFDGKSSFWHTLGGLGNVDDDLLHLPTGTYRAFSARTFDPATNQWAIWWLDGRNPHHIDPPVIGGFEDGVGTFVGEDTFNGIPILVRFRWSDITATTCRWEQAFSTDQGETWEVNWVMESTRIS